MTEVDFEQFHLLPSLLETLNVIQGSHDPAVVAKTVSRLLSSCVHCKVTTYITQVEACASMLQGLPQSDVPPEEKEEKFNELQEQLKKKW
jgi:hypothetical protein